MKKKEKKEKANAIVTYRMKSHFRQIGVLSVDEYKKWCSIRGFSKNLNKSPRQLDDERIHVVRDKADKMMQRSRDVRNPRKVLEKLIGGQMKWQDVRGDMQPICQYIQEIAQQEVKNALIRLSCHVEKYTDLITEKIVMPTGRFNIFDGLGRLAIRHTEWVREPETWRPISYNNRRRVSSLIRHLFAEYDVPVFMDCAWFYPPGPPGPIGECANIDRHRREQDWFLWIGQGGNIRKANIPVNLTKKMAHHFLEAPDDYHFAGAFRWGQVHGFGGNKNLADALLNTHLTNNYDYDDFWVTVIHWFVNNPMMDTAHIGPIIDYIHHQKYAPEEVFENGRCEYRPPPCEDFSMKGRTADALLRQTEEWHGALAKAAKNPKQWRPNKLNIKPWRFTEGQGKNEKVWVFTELLTSTDLMAEGKELKHCVSSYAGSCSRGYKSVWSLKKDNRAGDGAGPRRVLTIAIDVGEKMIREVRGSCNRKATAQELNIVNRWSERNQLTLGSYV